jgi:hypothetical protein
MRDLLDGFVDKSLNQQRFGFLLRDAARHQIEFQTWIERAGLLGPDGDARTQLLAGEPFSIAVDVASERAIGAPRLGWELRDDASILVAGGAVSTGELGWDEETRTLPLRFDAERPPFADGRLHLRVDLTDERGETQYHSLDDALVFVVYPADEARGLVRLEGRWAAAAELERL